MALPPAWANTSFYRQRAEDYEPACFRYLFRWRWRSYCVLQARIGVNVKIDPTWDVPEGRIDGELLMGLDLLLMARL